MTESFGFPQGYGIGTVTTYHGYCKHSGCEYVTEDYTTEQDARERIEQHEEAAHGI